MPRVAVFLTLVSAVLMARVDKVQVIDRTDVLDGKLFGQTAYECVVARVDFSVDPQLPANRIITDIDLAPRNAEGRVEFSSDLYVLKPLDPAKGNGTVLFEVSNRGRKGILGTFNRASGSLDPRNAAEFGDGFLLEQGYTLVWLGWQFDVPRDHGLMRMYPAVAKGVSGIVRSEFVPDRKITSFSLADRTHQPYEAAEPDDPAMQLTVRDRTDGPRRVIPRSEWRIADRSRVEMQSGFEPGKLYEVVYKANDPAIVGLGPAAIRDFISFLKYKGNGIQLLGDQARFTKRAVAFGTSQSGRFLRTFLYYGFNQNEDKQKVFDGVWVNVAGGGRGSFNHRFAQPSRDGHPFFNTFYPTDIFPFTDLPETDPETGLTDGLLTRVEAAGVTPKIFYTNSSYEYWGRSAGLIHASLDGKKDVAPAPNSRVYYIAGTQHGPGSYPPGRNNTQNAANSVDYRPVMRALLVAMNEWLVSGKEPPPSQYPLVGKDQLVPVGALNFPKVPGVMVPERPQRAWRTDYGPEFRTKGIVTIDPPKTGRPFAALVPQVDADGNETSGIRLPEVRVPLATYTGWNLRDKPIGSPDEIFSMVGSTIPLPRTRTEKQKTGDPRLAVEERYASRQEYLDRVESAARMLAGERYILERDIPTIMDRAARQWDHMAGTR